MRRMVGAMHFTYYSLTGGVIEEVMISANSFVDLGEFSRSSRRILSFISANSAVHLGEFFLRPRRILPFISANSFRICRRILSGRVGADPHSRADDWFRMRRTECIRWF